MKKPKRILKSVLKKREKRKLKRDFKTKLEEWKKLVLIRDNYCCQKCKKNLLNQQKNVHHIISLQSVKRKYPELLEDINNGITLCGYCHKFAPDSAHQGSMEFIQFFKENKFEQYDYLANIIYNKKV